MEESVSINKFVIECRKCQDAKRASHTNLYVNWEKKYYMISCLNNVCGETEAFDELGNKIDVKEEDVKPDENKKDEKLTN